MAVQHMPACVFKSNKKKRSRLLPVTYRHRNRWLQLCVGSAVLWLLCISIASASLRPVVGARALGMSGAFISSADDSAGALWNPAGLASLRYGSLIYDLSQGAVSFGYPIHYVGTLGFSALDLNGEDRFFHDHPNNPVGTFERGYNQFLLSYARSIGSRLQLGGNLGYNRVPNPDSQWTPSYDLGAIVKLPPHLILGARLIDISGVTIPDREGRLLKQFDQTFAVGLAWTPVQLLQFNSVLDTSLWQLRVGAEAGAHGLALRLGTAVDLIGRRPEPDWSVGLSVDISGKHLHYAYLRQPDVAYKHLLAVGLTFDLSGQTASGSVTKKETLTQRNGTLIETMATLTETREPSVKRGTASMRIETPVAQKKPVPVKGGEQTKAEKSSERGASGNRQVISDAKDAKSPTKRIAEQYDVEVELILALVKRESTFNPKAVSRNGAAGLLQLMPPTARDLGLKVPSYANVRKPRPDPSIDERFHPTKNLSAGVKYLHEMLERYHGDYSLALAAYNVGPGNVRQNRKLSRSAERHVSKVLEGYYQYKANADLKNRDLRKLDAVLR